MVLMTPCLKASVVVDLEGRVKIVMDLEAMFRWQGN